MAHVLEVAECLLSTRIKSTFRLDGVVVISTGAEWAISSLYCIVSKNKEPYDPLMWEHVDSQMAQSSWRETVVTMENDLQKAVWGCGLWRHSSRRLRSVTATFNKCDSMNKTLD